MNIEYEATFLNVDKDKMRKKLKKAGATLIKKEFLQKRTTFVLPKEKRAKGKWIRVRDEGDKITMSLKVVDGNRIENQKEVCLQVDDYKNAVSFLQEAGCEIKAYQETKRELWTLDNAEITIDHWPFLEPFVEVESDSEEAVKSVCRKLNFDYNQALFCAVGALYKNKYGVSLDEINNKTPKIVFEMNNPFIK